MRALKRIESRSLPHAIKGREIDGVSDLSRTRFVKPPINTARIAQSARTCAMAPAARPGTESSSAGQTLRQ
jgi:hypothetical protein